MSSALRTWSEFCTVCDIPNFPVTATWAARFASICRDPGTYRAYLAHLRSACEFFGLPTLWADSPEVARAKVGLDKQALVHKGPPLSVPEWAILGIASAPMPWHRERFFVTLAWVFLLRARSEATHLVFSNAPELSCPRLPLPEGVDALCGLAGNCLTIRLRSRKNYMHGDTINRACVCSSTDNSPHVKAAICPVHVLGDWLGLHCVPGKRISPNNIADSALSFLRIGLEARGVQDAAQFGLHAIRRGASQAIVDNGGDLATLLRAGGWRSSAFKSYLSMMGVEASVFAESAVSLVDCDDALDSV